MEQEECGPLGHVHRTVECVARQIAANWQGLPDRIHDAVAPVQRQVRHLAQWWDGTPFGQALSRTHETAGPAYHNNSQWMPMLASVTISHSPTGGPKPQPVMDVAMVREEVKARLAPVPVYTVANPKNEFVLVAGENNTQLGFFFFKKEDAEALVEKIKEENPRLARDSKILRVTMDNVYEVFTTPREQTGLQGIHFRFMPDMAQVAHALKLYKDAGVPTRQFIGVPVFQAEGLTVTTREMQYVPLFLCKEDLDIAVQSAYTQRNAAQIKLYKDKADKYQQEYDQVMKQLDAAKDGREKGSLESRAAKAKTKLDTAKDKVENVERAPLPKVEVGSFEEVIMRMTASSGNELAAWSQVMFVAPALLQEAVKVDGKPDSKK